MVEESRSVSFKKRNKMLDIVTQAIDRFFKKKDPDSFKTLCNKKIELPKKLQDYVDSKNLSFKSHDDKSRPWVEWHIYFDDYAEDEFKVSYSTVLKISKIIPAYYVEHEFKVENKDEDALIPVLCGSGGPGLEYSMGQYDLSEQIISILTKEGYQELGYSDMNEVIKDLKMPDELTPLGSQVTVEHLLFMDIFNLYEQE